MAGTVINLRRARKRRARVDAENRAAENRVRHGRTRNERTRDRVNAEKADDSLDAHQRTQASRDDDGAR